MMRVVCLLLIGIVLSCAMPSCSAPTPEGAAAVQYQGEAPLVAQAAVEVFVCPQDDCAGRLAAMINASSSAVCAFYALTEPRVVAAVRDGHVPLVLDFSAGGKKVVFDDAVLAPEGHTMHDKFCVLDGTGVVTGSFNPTKNLNHDLLVRVSSPELAEAYSREFLEMRGGVFGGGDPSSPLSIPTPDGSLSVLFCPDDPCEEMIVGRIRDARESVIFQAFSLTSDAIAQALIEAKGRGLAVMGVTEKGQESSYSRFSMLNRSGVPMALHDDRYLMHRKLFVIDGSSVITGSANPTRSGYFANDENVVMIDDPIVASSLSGRLLEEGLFSEPPAR